MKRNAPEYRFWQQLGTSLPPASDEASIRISSLSAIDMDPLLSLMRNRSIRRTEDASASLWLVIVDTLGDPRLKSINQQALASDIPLLVFKPAGLEFEYALFSRNSACWACFEKRHRLLDGPATYLYSVLGQQLPITEPETYTNASLSLAFHWIMVELERILTEPLSNYLQGTLRSVQFNTMHTSDHAITQLPSCAVCGLTTEAANYFPQPTEMDASNLDRRPSLEYTYQRVKLHVDHKTGIIPWVRPIPTAYAQGAFHLYVAKHPIRGEIQSVEGLTSNLRSSSSAIGRSAREAKQLAICEALERWSCVSQGDENEVSFTHNEIRSRAISPAELHCISDRQYAMRDLLNQTNPNRGRHIPEPLDPDQPVRWCPVYDLVNEQWKYVLKSSCFFGHQDDGHIFSSADSRGVAAGPNREFCLWNALLELIETDAGAIWNANRLTRPGVDIDSFNDGYFLKLKNIHHQLNRELWVLDISMDIAGVVVFTAISRDRQSGNVVKGFGTHPQAHKALEKALLECSQMLPNVIHSDAQITMPHRSTPYAVSTTTSKEAVLLFAHFIPDPSLDKRFSKDYPVQPSIRTIKELVQTLVQKGITPLVQDVSRPELNLFVLRVFGPGMRSWLDRRRQGRLFEVPVQLGLRDQSLSEDELNPDPL